MLSRTEIPAAAAVLLVNRDRDKYNPNRGSCPVFAAFERNAGHSRVSISPTRVDGAGG
jgi:hypothetical protein